MLFCLFCLLFFFFFFFLVVVIGVVVFIYLCRILFVFLSWSFTAISILIRSIRLVTLLDGQ